MGTHSIAGNEKGVILPQIVITSIILLTILLLGFRTVKTSIQEANMTATSAAFKDLVLELEESLAVSSNCTTNLLRKGTATPLTALPLVVVTNAMNGYPSIGDPAGYPVDIVDSGGNILAYEEGVTNAAPPPNHPYFPGFIQRQIRLTNLQPAGWNAVALTAVEPVPPPPGAIELTNYVGTLSIIVDRRLGSFLPTGGTTRWLAAPSMIASIPIELGVDTTGVIQNCTVQPLYAQLLGPDTLPAAALAVPGFVRKTGLECVDRGGTPVIADGYTYYSCRFPLISGANCGATTAVTIAGAPLGNIPGWYCLPIGGAAAGAYYAY